jgi:hypothetical protein
VRLFLDCGGKRKRDTAFDSQSGVALSLASASKISRPCAGLTGRGHRKGAVLRETAPLSGMSNFQDPSVAPHPFTCPDQEVCEHRIVLDNLKRETAEFVLRGLGFDVAGGRRHHREPGLPRRNFKTRSS